MTKTIEINIPKPGDSLPFDVLRNGDTVLEYTYEGELCLRDPLSIVSARNYAILFGIPSTIKVDLSPTVAEVPE